MLFTVFTVPPCSWTYAALSLLPPAAIRFDFQVVSVVNLAVFSADEPDPFYRNSPRRSHA